MSEKKPWLHEPFAPGNPGSTGRPAGVRNRLQGSFLKALLDDWEQHGVGVVKICRIEKPTEYLKLIASLVPKEFAIADAKLGDMSDEEIFELLATVRELRAQAKVEGPDSDEPAIH